MLFSFSNPAVGVSEPPGDFNSNYRNLKRLINKALKEGTPLEELRLIPKNPSTAPQRQLSREDLLKLLHIIRRIKTRYQRLLQSPVPRELERDIRAKKSDLRLPWENEALEKVEKWRRDVSSVRAQVQKELNDHLSGEFFRGL
jgi:predicted  nucleic acid-binding Zn-ribbon protein